MKKVTLEVKNLSVEFDVRGQTVNAVRDVSWNVKKGETYFVTCPSLPAWRTVEERIHKLRAARLSCAIRFYGICCKIQVFTYVYRFMYMKLYIYIYIERERERNR